MGEIARAVGIDRAVLYRHFASKEELFVLTVTRYLDELVERVREAVAAAGDDPREQFVALTRAYADYALAHPAFLDCALSLMRRPWAEQQTELSPGVAVQIAQSMAAALSAAAEVIAAGKATGAFDVEDADYAANHLYAQGLGAMHLARLGVGVRERAPGVPEAFPLDDVSVRDAVVRAALRLVGADAKHQPG